MRTSRALYLGMMAVGIAVLWTVSSAQLSAQQTTDPALRIGDNELGGVVTGPHGPEAGVWVIAETTDLPTKFAKIVVTDDRGRYVMPDLPKANYSVWVRGYGLVDSPKVQTAPGKILNLTGGARRRMRPRRRNTIRPIYWYSMLKIPDKSEFPGTGPTATACRKIEEPGRVAERREDQRLHVVSRNWATRRRARFPKDSANSRLGRGVGAAHPVRPSHDPDGQCRRHDSTRTRALKLFADWTDRIAAGELPIRAAGAAAGRRAQRRHHPVGLGDAQSLPAR